MLLVVLVTVAYIPAMQAGFVWDDDDNVTDNRYLRDLDGLKQIWLSLETVPPYYPLAHTALWVEYQLWQLAPFGYHLVNVLLHALNALLIWRILRRLGMRGAWVVAALFALHPVHVETVAWITEQKTLLSAAFYLAALRAYLQFNAPGRRPVYYALAFGLFVCALLTKTVAASLPVVLLLLIWWKQGRIRLKDYLPTVPFFIVGAGLGILTAWSEKHYVGALGPAWDYSIPERLMIAGRALWFYAGKLLWPHPLIYIYPRWHIDAATYLGVLYPLTAAAVPVVLWTLRKTLGRGLLVAVCFFGITVAPALGFFSIYYTRYSFVADRWVYLASVGVLALVVAGGVRLYDRLGRQQRTGGLILCAVILLLCGSGVWQQSRAYIDEETLWRDTLAKNPAAFAGHVNLGGILLARGEVEAAGRHFEDALRIDPDHFEAHNNLGIVQHTAGRYDDAIVHYLEAIRLDPTSADAHINLGITLATRGEYDDAIREFREAISLNPTLASAHANLAQVLFFMQDYAGAREHAAAAEQLAPGR